MNTITDIKIIGIDEQRPPMIRKEGYIDLYFKLSAKAPQDWCEDFNKLGLRIEPRTRINPATGLVIETYVRDANQIQEHLDKIKQQLKTCIGDYLEKERLKQLALAQRDAAHPGANAKQELLNAIIAGLRYDT